MTAHELGRYLLKCEDLEVYINGWGSDEGGDYPVTGAFYRGEHDRTCEFSRGKVIMLGHGGWLDYKSYPPTNWVEWNMNEDRIDV